MTAYLRHFFFLLLSILLGCQAQTLDPRYSIYEPILAERSALNTISFTAPKPMVNRGKIYSYKSFILINELDKGYHVIDNSDQSNPRAVGFIAIPASHEVAIQNDILFSDNATDLISVNIADITQPRFLKRTVNVFPNQMPPDNLPLPDEYNEKDRPANTVVIEWRIRK